MLFKRQVRKAVSKSLIDIIACLLIFFMFFIWVRVIYAWMDPKGSPYYLQLPELIPKGIFTAVLLVIVLYYSIDSSSSRKAGLFDEKRVKEEIDQRIKDAQTGLGVIRESIQRGVSESDIFDETAKQVILRKSGLIIKRCLLRLETAVRLREEADTVAKEQVKVKLLRLREYLILGVAAGIDQLGGILVRIQSICTQTRFNDASIGQLSSELDEELKMAEMVDKKMAQLEYGQILI